MADRLSESGFRPISEADCPHALCFLRLGPGSYTTGFRTEEDGVWLREYDLSPVSPTHYFPFPD